LGVTLSPDRESSTPVKLSRREEVKMANATATVQELYAAFGRGDLPGILAKLSDDVVWESEGPAAISSSGIRHGKAETQGFFEGLNNDFTDHNLTISDYVESGDTVMTLGRYTATAKTSGRKVDTPIAHYWKFRDGKVIRYVGLSNTAAGAEALQSAESKAA
jgi:ketosteroid isomerase-like protein